MGSEAHIMEKCPECSSEMFLVSHNFKPPKKTDTKKWNVAKFLIEKGFNYDHLYEKTEKGVYTQLGKYPENMKDAEALVKDFHNNGIKK